MKREKRSKIAEEVEAIAAISAVVPTAAVTVLSPIWYYNADPRLVIVLYLLGVIATASLCIAISLHDEAQKGDERR